MLERVEVLGSMQVLVDWEGVRTRVDGVMQALEWMEQLEYMIL